MPRYLTKVDRLISHESRTVKAGEFFHTEFPPGPDGQPMRLSDTLIEVDDDGNPVEIDAEGGDQATTANADGNSSEGGSKGGKKR